MYELYGGNSGAKINIIMNYELRIVNYFMKVKIMLQLVHSQILKNVHLLQ